MNHVSPDNHQSTEFMLLSQAFVFTGTNHNISPEEKVSLFLTFPGCVED